MYTCMNWQIENADTPKPIQMWKCVMCWPVVWIVITTTIIIILVFFFVDFYENMPLLPWFCVCFHNNFTRLWWRPREEVHLLALLHFTSLYLPFSISKMSLFMWGFNLVCVSLSHGISTNNISICTKAMTKQSITIDTTIIIFDLMEHCSPIKTEI